MNRQGQDKIIYNTDFLNTNLRISRLYINGQLVNIFLNRNYIINGKTKKFEICFTSDSNEKLQTEEHFVNGKLVTQFNCDTSITPTMKQVNNYILYNSKTK